MGLSARRCGSFRGSPHSGAWVLLAPWMGLAACVGTIADPAAQRSAGPAIGPGSSTATGGGSPTTGPADAGGAGAKAPLGPSAGRRLTKDEYLNSIEDLFGTSLGPDDIGSLPEDQPATASGFRNDVLGLLPTAVRTD